MTRASIFSIVGAGPAGMAAAIAARAHRARRAASSTSSRRRAARSGAASRRVAATRAARDSGRRLSSRRRRRRAFRASGAVYGPAPKLWQIEPGLRAFVTPRAPSASIVDAEPIVLATGAQERPVPFPGLDAARRADGRRRADPAEERGPDSGRAGLDRRQRPAAAALQAQLLPRAAGSPAISTRRRRADGAPRCRICRDALARGRPAQGPCLDARRSRAGVPIVRHVAEIEALGHGAIEALRYRTGDGRERDSTGRRPAGPRGRRAEHPCHAGARLRA